MDDGNLHRRLKKGAANVYENQQQKGHPQIRRGGYEEEETDQNAAKQIDCKHDTLLVPALHQRSGKQAGQDVREHAKNCSGRKGQTGTAQVMQEPDNCNEGKLVADDVNDMCRI